MYTFRQSTGQLLIPNSLPASGWSGHGEGLNNPSMQDVKNVGPLPRGNYTIGPAFTDAHLGPIVMALKPDVANEMYNRGGFFIHGAEFSHPELSSDGCIILPRVIRESIAEGTDRQLMVIE